MTSTRKMALASCRWIKWTWCSLSSKTTRINIRVLKSLTSEYSWEQGIPKFTIMIKTKRSLFIKQRNLNPAREIISIDHRLSLTISINRPRIKVINFDHYAFLKMTLKNFTSKDFRNRGSISRTTRMYQCHFTNVISRMSWTLQICAKIAQQIKMNGFMTKCSSHTYSSKKLP